MSRTDEGIYFFNFFLFFSKNKKKIKNKKLMKNDNLLELEPRFYEHLKQLLRHYQHQQMIEVIF